MSTRPVDDGGAIRCPDCDSKGLSRIGRLPDVRTFAGRVLDRPVAGGALFECRQCRLKFRHPVIDMQTSDALYDNGSVSAWSSALRTDQRLVLDHLDANTDAGSVLDFGCYTGQFLASLPARFERYGVEISDQAADATRRRAGARVWKDLDSIDPARRFDVIVCMDVVEHFPSPRRLLEALLARLAPAGRLLITTGDADATLWRRFGSRWWYCGYAEHIAFISGPWLRHHAGTLGANIVGCESFNYKDEGGAMRLLRWGALGAALAWTGGAAVLARAPGRADPPSAPSAITSLPGVGLTRDHLFIVIRKAEDDSPARARMAWT